MICPYCSNFTNTDFCSHCQEYIANCDDEEFDYHNGIETDINDDDYGDDDNSEWKENYTHE